MKLLRMESGIHETFAYGIRNPWNFCSWNRESVKLLLMESGMRKNFPCGNRNPGKFCLWNPQSGKILLVEAVIGENFAFEMWNPVKFCLWNLESGKSLLVESWIREKFVCGIRNPGKVCLWHPESWSLEFGIQLKESEVLLTIGIHNLSATEKDWNEVPGIRNPRAWNPESSTILDSLAWGVRRAVWFLWTEYQAKLLCSTVLAACTVFYAVQGGNDFWICKWNSRVWTLIQMNATEYCFLVLSQQLTIIRERLR